MRLCSCILLMLCTAVLHAQDDPPPPPQPPASWHKIDMDTIYDHVDQMPEIPGGIDSIARYLHSRVKYIVTDTNGALGYDERIRFIVEKDGSVGNMENPAPKYNDIELAYIRALMQLHFRPGMLAGRPVRVRLTLPLHIRYHK